MRVKQVKSQVRGFIENHDSSPAALLIKQHGVAVRSYQEFLKGQCWVLCCFCSTFMFCHRIFLMLAVCLPIMSYCIISVKTINFYRMISMNWRNWGKLRQFAFNTSKCSVLSIHNNTLQQLYYSNNSRLRNVLNHPYLGIELGHGSKMKKKTYN